MKLSRLHALVASFALAVAGCNGAVPPAASSAATPPPAAPSAPETPAAAPRAAETPKAAPAATATTGKLRPGIALDALAPAGLERRSLDVNAFRAEARLVFVASEKANVHLAVRVHDSPSAATEHLTGVARTLARRPLPAAECGLALPGFARVEGGLLSFAAVALDNLSAVVRLEGTLDEAADRAMRATLVAFQAAATEPLAPGTPLPRPVIRTLAASIPPRAEAATPLRLEVEPACAFDAFEATNGASVLRSKEGPVLYAGEPGPVTVKVAVASKNLLSATAEIELTVLPAE